MYLRKTFFYLFLTGVLYTSPTEASEASGKELVYAEVTRFHNEKLVNVDCFLDTQLKQQGLAAYGVLSIAFINKQKKIESREFNANKNQPRHLLDLIQKDGEWLITEDHIFGSHSEIREFIKKNKIDGGVPFIIADNSIPADASYNEEYYEGFKHKTLFFGEKIPTKRDGFSALFNLPMWGVTCFSGALIIILYYFCFRKTKTPQEPA